jgi:DNA-binding transcriptional MocR family regulator
MSELRRREIASIARRYGVWIIEDDVYGAFAGDEAPPPLVSFAPDRTLYLSGLSKTVAPGLRTGFLLAPDAALFDRLSGAVRAQSYSPPTLGALVATQWIQDGEADAVAAEIGAEVAARTASAQARLGGRLLPAVEPRCPHLWLPMAELESERLVARALRAGVQLTPAEAPVVDPTLISGVRLCVGAPSSRDQVEAALERLVTLFNSPQAGPDMGLV